MHVLTFAHDRLSIRLPRRIGGLGSTQYIPVIPLLVALRRDRGKDAVHSVGGAPLAPGAVMERHTLELLLFALIAFLGKLSAFVAVNWWCWGRATAVHTMPLMYTFHVSILERRRALPQGASATPGPLLPGDGSPEATESTGCCPLIPLSGTVVRGGGGQNPFRGNKDGETRSRE